MGLPTDSASANYKLVSAYSTTKSLIDSVDYGITRPANLISAMSTLSSPATALDSSSLNQFLSSDFAADSLVKGNSLSGSTEVRRSFDELYTRSAQLTTPTEFLASPTLSDATDKILPSDQTIAQQPFVNPQNTNEFFRSLDTGALSSSQASIDTTASSLTAPGLSELNTSASAAFATRAFTQPVLAPIVSAQPDRNVTASSLLGGNVFNTSIQPEDHALHVTTEEARGVSSDIKTGSADRIPLPLLNMY